MTSSRRTTAALLLLLGGPVAVGATAPPAVSAAPSAARPHGPSRPAPLDLGPVGLAETRTVQLLQPGVTLTRISRGGPDAALAWTLEVRIPATATAPDPAAPPRVIADRASADAEAQRLSAQGFVARVEEVARPRAADVAPGTLGFRVRIGSYPSRAAADTAGAVVTARGGVVSAVYTGWDGDRSARGPWNVNVVTVDPRRFRGALVGSFGPDLRDRETTSQLARAAGASVAVNGGYFVLDPASGAPGDPAGVGVYDGRLLSEPVGDRPALVLQQDARGSAVSRLRWQGSVRAQGRSTLLDGVDRVPGLVRNCGGDPTDLPTALPLHDVTCTDSSELVAFTPEYGPSTPAGPGREVVLDTREVVREVRTVRGGPLPAGTTSLQATGELVPLLQTLTVGERVDVGTRLVDDRGRPVRRPGATVVNGGPQLVRHGREAITQRRDGFVRPTDPSFSYGFVLKRNPRTFAGVDAHGRTVLVTVDGRSTEDLGLSVPESADVARSLGLVDALNLDGGGSTTLAVGGALASRPSDTAGERPVGDALLVLPGRR